MTGTETPKRHPYLGSCHCGKIRYIAFLTLPANPPYVEADEFTKPPQLIRRCNCTWCHKSSFLHVRLADSPMDFLLLSPLQPFKELGDYVIRPDGGVCVFHNLFCPTCGVRCFGIGGPPGKELGSVVERELVTEGVDLIKAGIDGDGRSVKVWTPNPDGWQEEMTHWLRLNGTSLEPGQEGLDLREWTERKWVQYANNLDDEEVCSYERPYHGGAY